MPRETQAAPTVATLEVDPAQAAAAAAGPQVAGSAGAGPFEPSLLERLLAAPLAKDSKSDEQSALLAPLLAARTPAAAATALLGERRYSSREAARLLDAAVARLDRLLSDQVNAILHAPRFQALEGSWRGLEFVWRQARDQMERSEEHGESSRIIIRVLPVSKRELRDDASTAVDFDQSDLWRKVYEAEFGTAGGTPFGLLIGDYEFRNHPDDLEMLSSISAVAAAAFAPFVAAAAPQFFGLDEFQRLELGLSLEQDFQRPDYIKWRALRASDDARFIGLTLPRVLMRRPYRLDVAREDGFRFVEQVAEENRRSKYLWGNAAYAFAGVVVRAFGETGWFADIRGF
jgi:type VI secretion system ImpC/EvpB family protein